MPAHPCLTDHRSRRLRQSGQGRRVPSTTTVAVPGHLLRGEQQDRRGPGDRLRQGLDGPRNSGLRHAQDLSDHRLHDVLTQVHRSRPQRPGQAQDRRIPLDPLLAQPGEQPVELVIGQSRGTLHHDGPLVPGSWGVFFHTHDTPREWAIIISPPGNDPGHTQNNLPATCSPSTRRPSPTPTYSASTSSLTSSASTTWRRSCSMMTSSNAST